MDLEKLRIAMKALDDAKRGAHDPPFERIGDRVRKMFHEETERQYELYTLYEEVHRAVRNTI